MAGPTLSRFTPSVMSHELLERLFVARDRLLEEIMRRIEAASTSTERHHTLLVGPRGAGKTHVVSLVYHRTKASIDEGPGLQVAWLPEDPWTIVSYRHLLSEIASRLEPAVGGDLPRSVAELEGHLAGRAAEGGPIVVIVENLDLILRSIEEEGQQQLRHLLQADRSLLLVATTTTLDRSLSDQSRPFYSFFTTTRLEPFDVGEATAMLTAIARERGDEELVDYLASSEGQARLRTIEHLAGGQPRMWAALASALTVEGLDDLVDLLLTRFDDLTPYYQEQLARLSAHQRLVVSELAEADRPMTIKELAERLELGERSVGKTVNDLVDKRWIAETTSAVTAMLDRRRTYYELAEPMARLSFQIKDNRGEPLRVVVDFLKHWFDPEDLRSLETLTAATSEGTQLTGYVRAAALAQNTDDVTAAVRHLSGLPITAGSATSILAEIDDALASLQRGASEPFLCLPAAVRSAIEGRLADRSVDAIRFEVHEAALSEVHSGFLPAAMADWVERAQQMAAHGRPDGWRGRAQLARWLAKAGRLGEARETLMTLPAPINPLEAVVMTNSLVGVANVSTLTGDLGTAANLFGEALRVLSASPTLLEREVEEIMSALLDNQKGLSNLEERLHAAIEDQSWVTEAVERLPGTYAVASAMAHALAEDGRHDEAADLRARVADVSCATWGVDDPRTVAAREAAERG